MKIIATTAMGKKLVAILDNNNQVREDVMSVDFAWFNGGNKDSKGGNGRDLSWGNWLEVTDTVMVSNKLTDINPTSRVFANISVTPSKKFETVSGDGALPTEFPENAEDIRYYPESITEHGIFQKECWLYSLVTITGWTSGNSLVELDLTTLTKKTVEVFSVHDSTIRRKINLKQFSFLVLNY